MLENFKILKGIEADILSDGSLDYTEDVLAGFDFVIAAVHSGFSMDEDEMTERILLALDNPYTTILAHPTGRLLLSRKGYPLDIEKILEKAARKGVFMEINANPHRLDLDWRWYKQAKEMGIRFVIGADAHDLRSFHHTRYGVWMARKGWLEKKHVINCLEFDKIQAAIEGRR
jgi:DNA polymerase (family 10)